ncbi:hypothetical protein HPB47_027911 [Ixodes persulcatus]|uniref:Uncharacterized protein n=1 Tax=Ixodes persulcatus TaxID=34615 RepID=A0AC60PUP9_IXOPE|nr:hypothetical protein HPB47_027911 [Ixodes persulcatus]
MVADPRATSTPRGTAGTPNRGKSRTIDPSAPSGNHSGAACLGRPARRVASRNPREGDPLPGRERGAAFREIPAAGPPAAFRRGGREVRARGPAGRAALPGLPRGTGVVRGGRDGPREGGSGSPTASREIDASRDRARSGRWGAADESDRGPNASAAAARGRRRRSMARSSGVRPSG